MADNWGIRIQGTSGMHGRGAVTDADRVAKQMAETLRNAGHQIEAAEFCVLEPEGDPLRLLDGVPTFAEALLERATKAAPLNQTNDAEAGSSGGPQSTDAAAASEA